MPLGPLSQDSYAELAALRDKGLCRYIGMSGYPAAVMKAAMTETDLNVCLTYDTRPCWTTHCSERSPQSPRREASA